VSGSRSKKLRKLAWKIHPEGSGMIVYNESGSLEYTGMRRLYRDMKKEWTRGYSTSARVAR